MPDTQEIKMVVDSLESLRHRQIMNEVKATEVWVNILLEVETVCKRFDLRYDTHLWNIAVKHIKEAITE